MSKQPPESSDVGLKRQSRHSLQLNPNTTKPDSSRLTQSQRYEDKGKKKEKKAVFLTVIPDAVEVSIPDGNEPPTKVNKLEPGKQSERKSSRTSKTSKCSRLSEMEKNSYVYDNQVFDDKFDKRSITSSKAGSSVQSME